MRPAAAAPPRQWPTRPGAWGAGAHPLFGGGEIELMGIIYMDGCESEGVDLRCV